MSALLVAATIAAGAGELVLLLVCWWSRTVLGGVLGLVGLALAVWAIAAGPMRGAGKLALVGALVALVVGSCLFVAGKALARLLEEPEQRAEPE